MDPRHKIELHYDKRAPAARRHWGECSCGEWESGRMMTPGMVHAAHYEHVHPVGDGESPTKD